MKEFSHKIFAILMSFVVLFSTSSFAITEHYCAGTLVDAAIFSKASSCGMEIENTSTSSDCSFLDIDCCSDQQILKNAQDELQTSAEKISFEQKIFIASFIYTYINLFKGVEENINSYGDTSPSFVVKDIYKLDESYLI